MSKVALICDTHWGHRDDNPVLLGCMKKSMNNFFRIICDEGVRHVIHLGDVYHRRKYINYETAKRCREDLLEPLARLPIECHFIGGNHDEYYKNSHCTNALDELITGRYPNIKTYLRTEVIEIDGLNIQLMPWISDSNYEESLDAIKQPKADILMGHLEIEGFQMEKGLVSHTGLTANIFGGFHSVYSGHFHHPSMRDNIRFLGAFAEFIWSDFGDPRGFHIFDPKDRSLKFHKNTNSIFKMIKYDDNDPEIADRVNGLDYSRYKDCYVKIVCLNKKNPFYFNMLLDKVQEVGPIDVSIIEGHNITENGQDDIVDQAEDTPTILNKYLDGLTLPVDTNKMKHFMNEIYQESVSIGGM